MIYCMGRGTEMGTVSLTQYLRPNGRKEEVTCEVPDDVAEMAKDMILSCETLTTGEVVIYARKSDWDEENELMEFATNSPGPNQPDLALARLIKRCYESQPDPIEYDPMPEEDET
jgi:hypothetical protein